jgi:hypothetical protein
MVLADPDPPSVQTQDQLGSYRPGALPWFLKLDRSTNQLVDDEPWPGVRPPLFLGRINAP